MNPYFQMCLGFVFIVLGIFGPLILKDGLDRKAKQSEMNQIDAFSLEVIAQNKGLIFVSKNIDAATLRYLLKASFIKTEIFPSNPTTYGYYLTKEGRDFASKKLNREIYPEIFCDLIRIRYWEGYPSDFIKRKEEFKRNYKVTWEGSWKALGDLFKQDQKPQKDPIESFNSFASSHDFESVMRQVVTPWLKEINK